MSSADIIYVLSSDDDDSQTRRSPPSKTLGSTTRDQYSQPSLWTDPIANIDGEGSERPFKKAKLSPLRPLSQINHNFSDAALKPRLHSKTRHAGSTKGKENWAPAEIHAFAFDSVQEVDLGVGRTATRTKEPTQTKVIEDDSDFDSLPEDIFEMPLGQSKLHDALSSKTASLLANLSKPSIRGRSYNTSIAIGPRGSKERSTSIMTAPSSQEVHMKDGVKTQKKAKLPRLTEEEKAKRAQAKEEERTAKTLIKEKAKEEKARGREEDLERKRVQKEERAREKQREAELAEVNKARVDKKISAQEMIVDLPISIDGDPLDRQTREFLKDSKIEASTYQSGIPNIVKWRRKCKSKWNDTLERWEPTDLRIETERHIMCIMHAKELVARVVGDSEEDLDIHVGRFKSLNPDCIPMYLVEGLSGWFKKNRTTRERAWQADFRAQIEEHGDQPARRRKRPLPEVIDEEVIEDALMRLQVHHGCLIHQTKNTVESAQWIAVFSQNISIIPHTKRQMNLETAFCMDYGQVKTGENQADTFVKMLQEIVRVTLPMARTVADDYPNVVALVRGFREHGPYLLEDLKLPSDRRFGPAVSRRLYSVFMGTDPASTDV